MASSLVQAVSNRLVIIRNIPTIQATPDYATGDLFGGKQELLNAVEEVGGGGIVRGVSIANAAAIAVDVDAVFFNADPSGTTFTENSALDIADADLDKIAGACQIGTWFAFNDNSFGMAQDVHPLCLPFVIPSGTSLFMALVIRGAANQAAADDVDVRVAIERI